MKTSENSVKARRILAYIVLGILSFMCLFFFYPKIPLKLYTGESNHQFV